MRWRWVEVLVGAGMVVLIAATSASAQVDITGSFSGIFHEDQPERVPGSTVGDYTGLPVNDAARAFADAWDASRLSMPEQQCRAHSSPHIMRGPLNMRIWEERDPLSQRVVALHIDVSNFQQRRVIWMDDRPHPSPLAAHTWMGFSTGRWDGDTLMVTTTHIKSMWHRRNGLPQSSQTLLTEYFVLHGNVLTQVTYTDDPVYLTEPLVKTTNMLRSSRTMPAQQLLFPCSVMVELADLQRGAVPHYLPGENPYLGEFAAEFGLPEEAARGGASTMYPEFGKQLKATSTSRSAPRAGVP